MDRCRRKSWRAIDLLDLTEVVSLNSEKFCFALTADERMSPEFKVELKTLDEAIERKIGDKRTDAEVEDDLPGLAAIPDGLFEDDEPVTDKNQIPDANENYSLEVFDQYLTVNVLLDRGGDVQLRMVVERKRDHDGNAVGRSNTNPLLETCVCEVEFPDGSDDVLTADTIVEALY